MGVRGSIPRPGSDSKHGLIRQNADSRRIRPTVVAVVAVKHDTVVTQRRVPSATSGNQ
jgi:hypothetical protein